MIKYKRKMTDVVLHTIERSRDGDQEIRASAMSPVFCDDYVGDAFEILQLHEIQTSYMPDGARWVDCIDSDVTALIAGPLDAEREVACASDVGYRTAGHPYVPALGMVENQQLAVRQLAFNGVDGFTTSGTGIFDGYYLKYSRLGESFGKNALDEMVRHIRDLQSRGIAVTAYGTIEHEMFELVITDE